MNLVKNIIHGISFIFYIVVGIYAITFVSLLWGYKPIVTMIDTMSPTYKKGSVIYYKPIDIEQLEVGDIITYKNDKKELISERIVSMKDNKIQVKGDNSNVTTTITEDEVIGFNSNVSIMFIGYIILIINYNIIISIGLFIIIIVSDFILSHKEEKEENEEKQKKKKEN